MHFATLRNKLRHSILGLGGGTLAERKAKWQNDYIARTYDRVNLTMPKGRKEVIQAKADAQGESVNAYINKAIEQRMEREAGE